MKVGIVGAGASGMMAAVTAADYGAEVIVFERNERILPFIWNSIIVTTEKS